MQKKKLLLTLISVLVAINLVAACTYLAFNYQKNVTANVVCIRDIPFTVTEFEDFGVNPEGSTEMTLDLSGHDQGITVVVLFDETVNAEFKADCQLGLYYWNEIDGYSSSNPLPLNYAQELFLANTIHYFRLQYSCVEEFSDHSRDVNFQLIEA